MSDYFPKARAYSEQTGLRPWVLALYLAEQGNIHLVEVVAYPWQDELTKGWLVNARMQPGEATTMETVECEDLVVVPEHLLDRVREVYNVVVHTDTSEWLLRFMVGGVHAEFLVREQPTMVEALYAIRSVVHKDHHDLVDKLVDLARRDPSNDEVGL